MTDLKDIREGQKVTLTITGVAAKINDDGVASFHLNPGPAYDYIYVDQDLIDAGATIEVEKDPFPTEYGVYVPRHNSDFPHHSYLYIKQAVKGWKEYNGATVVSDAEASARDAHARLGGLVRLGLV